MVMKKRVVGGLEQKEHKKHKWSDAEEILCKNI